MTYKKYNVHCTNPTMWDHMQHFSLQVMFYARCQYCNSNTTICRALCQVRRCIISMLAITLWNRSSYLHCTDEKAEGRSGCLLCPLLQNEGQGRPSSVSGPTIPHCPQTEEKNKSSRKWMLLAFSHIKWTNPSSKTENRNSSIVLLLKK